LPSGDLFRFVKQQSNELGEGLGRDSAGAANLDGFDQDPAHFVKNLRPA
jgi:hypothetical protein